MTMVRLRSLAGLERLLLEDQLRGSGIQMSSRPDQIDMVRTGEVNDLRAVIDDHFPRQQIADAIRYDRSGPAHVRHRPALSPQTLLDGGGR